MTGRTVTGRTVTWEYVLPGMALLPGAEGVWTQLADRIFRPTHFGFSADPPCLDGIVAHSIQIERREHLAKPTPLSELHYAELLLETLRVNGRLVLKVRSTLKHAVTVSMRVYGAWEEPA